MYRIDAAHSSYLPVNAAHAYSRMPTRPRNKSHSLDILIGDIHTAGLICLKLRETYHTHHNKRLVSSMKSHCSVYPVKC